MESPPTKKALNLEDSGCVVDGLRSGLSDGDVEDENSMMVRFSVSYTPFYALRLMSNFTILQLFVSSTRNEYESIRTCSKSDNKIPS